MSIEDYLQTCERTFDLVVVADVLSYIGDLRDTITKIYDVMRPGAHLTFTVESIPPGAGEAPNGFRLLSTGRFGYTKEYRKLSK